MSDSRLPVPHALCSVQRRVLPPLPSPGASPQTDVSPEPDAGGVHSAAGVRGNGVPGIQLAHASIAPRCWCVRLIQQSDVQDSAQQEASRRSHLLPKKPSSKAASSDFSSYLRAQENWETITGDMVQRWAANGGKGRKITVNASGMVCTSYESYLRRFPGTLLSEMVRDPGGDLHKKR
jgi:hypothetical protein